MAYTIDSIPDLTGTVSLVTGANSGVGLATAQALAAKGSHVVMAARDRTKAEAAEARIHAAAPDASTEIVDLDLASLESIAGAADAVLRRHEQLGILVNNAGLMAMPEGRTVDGFETQFGVNHLGHWALTARLMPALLAAPAARVVTVTSSAHHIGTAVDPANPHLHGRYGPWKAYGNAKLANYHFAIGLQNEFARAGVSAASLLAHPGLSNTNLQAQTAHEGAAGVTGSLSVTLAKRVGMSSEWGAMSQIRAATDTRAKGGQFYAPRYVMFGPPVLRPVLRPGNRAAIATLWAVSERETGLRIEVANRH
ncbi:MAG: SDR family NAD(P)-dependent oxidoreductase [Actinomycetota bacterium]